MRFSPTYAASVPLSNGMRNAILNFCAEIPLSQSGSHICSSTLTSAINDVLTRLNLRISNCRGQCYDGASNMVGIRSGVTTVLQREEPRAILTHCYGHSLQLAVCDTVKQVKVMQDALDTTYENYKVVKILSKERCSLL